MRCLPKRQGVSIYIYFLKFIYIFFYKLKTPYFRGIAMSLVNLKVIRFFVNPHTGLCVKKTFNYYFFLISEVIIKCKCLIGSLTVTPSATQRNYKMAGLSVSYFTRHCFSAQLMTASQQPCGVAAVACEAPLL